MAITGTRPSLVKEEHLTYLDQLRASGATNMWGAGAYVQERFSVNKYDANKIVGYWKQTYGKDNR